MCCCPQPFSTLQVRLYDDVVDSFAAAAAVDAGECQARSCFVRAGMQPARVAVVGGVGAGGGNVVADAGCVHFAAGKLSAAAAVAGDAHEAPELGVRAGDAGDAAAVVVGVDGGGDAGAVGAGERSDMVGVASLLLLLLLCLSSNDALAAVEQCLLL